MDGANIDRFLRRTTLRQIEVMVAVQKHGSMSRAAEELGMSVANVSRVSQRFQANLETRIFSEAKRKTELLDEGHQIIDCLKPLLKEISVLRSKLGKTRFGSPD